MILAKLTVITVLTVIATLSYRIPGTQKDLWRSVKIRQVLELIRNTR